MRTKLGYLWLQQKMSRKVLLYVKTKTPEQGWHRSGALFFNFDCISIATLSMYFVDWFNLANVKNSMLTFIELPCIFSEHMPLSWLKLKFMFYVDNNNFHMLKNTKELNGERYLWRSLFIKVAGCNFTSWLKFLLQVFIYFLTKSVG